MIAKCLAISCIYFFTHFHYSGQVEADVNFEKAELAVANKGYVLSHCFYANFEWINSSKVERILHLDRATTVPLTES